MADTVWQLQEAKNRFSEVVNKALSEGAQTVTRHGEEIVVVLSKAEYDQLRNNYSSISRSTTSWRKAWERLAK